MQATSLQETFAIKAWIFFVEQRAKLASKHEQTEDVSRVVWELVDFPSDKRGEFDVVLSFHKEIAAAQLSERQRITLRYISRLIRQPVGQSSREMTRVPDKILARSSSGISQPLGANNTSFATSSDLILTSIVSPLMRLTPRINPLPANVEPA